MTRLRLALVFELRSLVRNRAGALALAAYVAMGFVALGVGARHTAGWEAGLQAALEAQEASIAEARGYLAEGKKGPEDRSWIDLSKAHWQDEYAATRVVREPSALSGIAAGSVDPAPVAFHLRPWSNPLTVAGSRIENPEVSQGSVDLLFVLTLLTPLLVGAIGFDIGGREREERIDRILVVQAGEVGSWLLARAGAVTAIAEVAAVGLCLTAGWIGGARAVDLGVLAALTAIYTAVWGGLLLLVSSQASSVRVGAFAFGMLWTVVCVLMPAAVAELGVGRVQGDFALGETLEARAERQIVYAQDDEERMEQLYARFPDLRELPAAEDEVLVRPYTHHAYKGLQLALLDKGHDARLEQERAAQRLAELASWASPPLALTLGLERVAGVGPEAASAYRSYLVDAFENRLHWIVIQDWKKAPLDRAAFDALVADAPAPFRWTPQGLLGPALQLGAWCALAWMLAMVGLFRAERRGPV